MSSVQMQAHVSSCQVQCALRADAAEAEAAEAPEEYQEGEEGLSSGEALDVAEGESSGDVKGAFGS